MKLLNLIVTLLVFSFSKLTYYVPDPMVRYSTITLQLEFMLYEKFYKTVGRENYNLLILNLLGRKGYCFVNHSCT